MKLNRLLKLLYKDWPLEHVSWNKHVNCWFISGAVFCKKHFANGLCWDRIIHVFSLGFISRMVKCNAGICNLLLFRFLCVCISVILSRSIFSISGFRGLSCRRLQQNHCDTNWNFCCDFTAMKIQLCTFVPSKVYDHATYRTSYKLMSIHDSRCFTHILNCALHWY